VEDEPGVREIAVQSLAELGYATITAADGPEALQRLHESDRIELLFSDIVMPGGISGLELAEQARRMRPELKVLLTSGYATVTGDRLPPDVQLLPKPYSRAELAAHLQAAVGVATAG
jgi:CheY-like chemotaxis protein